MPVITPRQTCSLVHALLDHGPISGIAQDETVQVDLKAVGYCVVIDFCREAAGSDQRLPVEIPLLGNRQQFRRCPTRLFSSAAAEIDTKLIRARIQSAF